MSKTLFWYIFKDLLKVFLLTSGAIAGIMSFAGLLRPLTQHGLDPAQMVEMLGYFLPAMTNYSWPVAALFATTFVYGRLAADNELLAMRATGIGWAHILFPAALLSFVVMVASLAMMLFVVPDSFRRAENVVYTNLARFVANEIQRNRKIIFPAGASRDLSISARDAVVLAADPSKPREQAVQLNNVTIVRYANADNEAEPKRPSEFYVARSANVYITMPATEDGEVQLSVRLEKGGRFDAEDATRDRRQVRALIEQQETPPYPLPSPRRETARFMSFDRLMQVRQSPDLSARVGRLLTDFRRLDQQRQFRDSIVQQLQARRQVALVSPPDPDRGGAGTTYFIVLPPTPQVPPAPAGGRRGDGTPREFSENGEKLLLTAGTADEPMLTFRQVGGIAPFEARARQIEVTTFPDNEKKELILSVTLLDAIILASDGSNASGSANARTSSAYRIHVPMPEAIQSLSKTTAAEYLTQGRIPGTKVARDRLRGALIRQVNHVEAELHVRFAFAMACLVLVLVGAVVGTMFRSGNFVSAFAISTVPAMIALMLIMTGQHMSENVPEIIADPQKFADPLKAGLWTIWSGDIAVAIVGLGLFMKLRTT